MDRSDGLDLHALTPADAERGFALSTEIGWNQTVADWRYMLGHGDGFGRSNRDGKLVASAMALGYGPFAWVCMVLVSPDYRRRGIATDLMNRVTAQVHEIGAVPGLDATPAGREVYGRIGYNDIYGLLRLEIDAAPVVPDQSGRTPVRIEPVAADQLTELATYDRVLFGADRTALLEHLFARRPSCAFAAWAGEWVAGYVLGRDGRQASQIGPVLAEDDDIAIALLERALVGVDGPVFIDAMDCHVGVVAWLESAGFRVQRPYTRMLYGRTEPFDDVERVFAAAGPELG